MKNKHIHPVEPLHDSAKTVIHSSAFIHPTAYIHPGTRIGKNVAVMEHAVIGPRGMTFNVFEDEKNWRKIGKLCWRRRDADYPVVIEDDVYIGAKSVIVRGNKWNTRVGKGTVIGLDVSIGHDNVIGERCIILTKTMTCGSVSIGDFTYIAPSVTVKNGVKIGKDVTIGIGSLVLEDVPDGVTIVGRPAEDIESFRKEKQRIRELQDLNKQNNKVAEDFKHGKNFKIGSHCVIQEGCEVGDDVDIQHFVLLKKGTKIGNNVYVDSFFRSSGSNKIGNNVILRFGSTIAREVTVEDDVFISPNVMTIYSDHKGVRKSGMVIGKGAYIGTNVVINAGVKIAPSCVVGAMSLITKDLTEQGVYVGIPAKKVRDL